MMNAFPMQNELVLKIKVILTNVTLERSLFDDVMNVGQDEFSLSRMSKRPMMVIMGNL